MLSKAMQYEDIKPTKTIGKHVTRKEAMNTLDSYNSTTLLVYLVKRHKFGLLLAFTVIFVVFTLFGTLIVGLIESVIR